MQSRGDVTRFTTNLELLHLISKLGSIVTEGPSVSLMMLPALEHTVPDIPALSPFCLVYLLCTPFPFPYLYVLGVYYKQHVFGFCFIAGLTVFLFSLNNLVN